MRSVKEKKSVAILAAESDRYLSLHSDLENIHNYQYPKEDEISRWRTMELNQSLEQSESRSKLQRVNKIKAATHNFDESPPFPAPIFQRTIKFSQARSKLNRFKRPREYSTGFPSIFKSKTPVPPNPKSISPEYYIEDPVHRMKVKQNERILRQIDKIVEKSPRKLPFPIERKLDQIPRVEQLKEMIRTKRVRKFHVFLKKIKREKLINRSQV